MLHLLGPARRLEWGKSLDFGRGVAWVAHHYLYYLVSGMLLQLASQLSPPNVHTLSELHSRSALSSGPSFSFSYSFCILSSWPTKEHEHHGITIIASSSDWSWGQHAVRNRPTISFVQRLAFNFAASLHFLDVFTSQHHRIISRPNSSIDTSGHVECQNPRWNRDIGASGDPWVLPRWDGSMFNLRYSLPNKRVPSASCTCTEPSNFLHVLCAMKAVHDEWWR